MISGIHVIGIRLLVISDIHVIGIRLLVISDIHVIKNLTVLNVIKRYKC